MEADSKDAAPLEQAFTRAVAIMARLRAPGGCPWDREQTFDSIRRHTLEETYEVLDAIERRNWPHLKDELGDLLLQVLFYAEMARESGYFTLEEVIENLNVKLVRRHPHVFGNVEGVRTSEHVLANWEAIKRAERADAPDTSLLDAVPRALPALMEASKLGSKAASVGFDWDAAEAVFTKIEEEIQELRQAIASGAAADQEEELGDLLFTVVNLSRKLGLQSELALRSANAKFRRRFAAMEAAAGEHPMPAGLSAERLDVLWNQSKSTEVKESK